jgi:RNA-binding motif X-linked protein 2
MKEQAYKPRRDRESRVREGEGES